MAYKIIKSEPSYHSLGANGVMDDLHEKFLDLSTEAPNK